MKFFLSYNGKKFIFFVFAASIFWNYSIEAKNIKGKESLGNRKQQRHKIDVVIQKNVEQKKNRNITGAHLRLKNDIKDDRKDSNIKNKLKRKLIVGTIAKKVKSGVKGLVSKLSGKDARLKKEIKKAEIKQAEMMKTLNSFMLAENLQKSEAQKAMGNLFSSLRAYQSNATHLADEIKWKTHIAMLNYRNEVMNN